MGGSKPGALKHEMYPCPGVYTDRFIYGADFDADRVQVAKSRISQGLIRVADCDSWPFYDVKTPPLVVADFDAWAEPWPAFRAFWQNATKGDRVIMFFTSAHRMGIMVDGTHIFPDGSKMSIQSLTERRAHFNFYWSKYVFPWLTDYVKPYHVLDKMVYLRGMITYFGLVVDRTGSV